MKKAVFIIPYYGKFPNYFQLFLNSCEKNNEYNWLIITDNEEKYKYPNNVKVIKKTFDEIKKIIQNKFNFEISLETPYKFCDYRPAYGYIFEEYIQGYNYWGYCDVDLIWGNINNFLKEHIFKRYEKIFVNGHMSLYKNTYINNRRFMEEDIYKKYFLSNKNYAFDELWNGSINDIYKNLSIEIYDKKLCADIYPRNANFRLVLGYSQDYFEEFIEKNKKSIFTYENNNIIRYYIQKEQIMKKEYLYIHLQKRKMNLTFNPLKVKNYIIIPNEFLELNQEINYKNYKKIKKYKFTKRYIEQFIIGRKLIFLDFLSEKLSSRIKIFLKNIIIK